MVNSVSFTELPVLQTYLTKVLVSRFDFLSYLIPLVTIAALVSVSSLGLPSFPIARVLLVFVTITIRVPVCVLTRSEATDFLRSLRHVLFVPDRDLH